MRIVGGKDFYDSASAYGIDPGIVFVRDSRKLTRRDLEETGHWGGPAVSLSEDIEVPENPPRGWRRQYAATGGTYYRSYDSNVINGVLYGFIPHVVVFCGKVYRGITITTKNARTMIDEQSFHFWSADRLRKWAAERELIAEPSGGYWVAGGKRPPLEEVFKVHDLEENYIQAMIKHGAAILWQKEEAETPKFSNGVAMPYSYARYQEADSGWRINPDGLKDIGFQSAVDPVTAFQELAMWVGGTLSATNGPNTVTITDDNVKLAKHGMDKWSFRKKTENSKP